MEEDHPPTHSPIPHRPVRSDFRSPFLDEEKLEVLELPQGGSWIPRRLSVPREANSSSESLPGLVPSKRCLPGWAKGGDLKWRWWEKWVQAGSHTVSTEMDERDFKEIWSKGPAPDNITDLSRSHTSKQYYIGPSPQTAFSSSSAK